MIKILDALPEAVPMFEIVDQYDSFFKLGLTDQDKSELIRYVLGPIDPPLRLRPASRAADGPINSRGLS